MWRQSLGDDAELVALGIRHHDPRRVWRLSEVDAAATAERELARPRQRLEQLF